VTDFARSLLGYWPAFVLAGIAAALIVAGYPLASLPFDAASLTYSVIRYRRAVAQRQMERTSTPARVVMRGRRTFEPYTLCPSCEVATYHVFGALREEADKRLPLRWAMGLDDVWNYPGVWKVREPVAQSAEDAEPTFTTVVDRECLSCGHEWTEDV
jgi:hypothetical protein